MHLKNRQTEWTAFKETFGVDTVEENTGESYFDFGMFKFNVLGWVFFKSNAKLICFSTLVLTFSTMVLTYFFKYISRDFTANKSLS